MGQLGLQQRSPFGGPISGGIFGQPRSQFPPFGAQPRTQPAKKKAKAKPAPKPPTEAELTQRQQSREQTEFAEATEALPTGTDVGQQETQGRRRRRRGRRGGRASTIFSERLGG